MSLEEIEDLRARARNTEKALAALLSLIDDIIPEPNRSAVTNMMNDYLEANISLGMNIETVEFEVKNK
tara:strand:- start:79160 stop:79363 length:204 start_codon:yes stop_codon:yes gene_type:complete